MQAELLTRALGESSSNLPAGPVELNERERENEIRLSAFRHRTLLRQRHKCRLERAFVCWDFAFSSRKTRNCITTRCSQQRRRRSAAATLVQWRAEASKVRRCRRLGVIYVTRRLDVTLGTFVSEWQLLVLMRRKCFKFFSKQNEGKGAFVFEAWLHHFRTGKILKARIRQCMGKIERRSILRNIHGWKDRVRMKRRMVIRGAKAAQIWISFQVHTYFRGWREFLFHMLKLHNQENQEDQESQNLYRLAKAAKCRSYFNEWRKHSKLALRNAASRKNVKLDVHDHVSLRSWITSKNSTTHSDLGGQWHDVLCKIPRQIPGDDTVSRRVAQHRIVSEWHVMVNHVLSNYAAHVEITQRELTLYYERWAAFTLHKVSNRQQEKRMWHRRITCMVKAWRELVAFDLQHAVITCKIQSRQRFSWQRRYFDALRRNRARKLHLRKITSGGGKLRTRTLVQKAFMLWQHMVCDKWRQQQLLRVLEVILVKKRDRTLLHCAFCIFQAEVLVPSIVRVKKFKIIMT